MKLRHQVLLLIAIPVSCQLLSVGVLLNGSVALEAAGRKETNAKKVASTCQELEGVMGLRVFQLARASFLPRHLKTRDYTATIQACIDQLKSLSADNKPAATIVDKMQLSTRKYLALMEDLSQSYVPGNDVYFALILYKTEFFESVAHTFAELKSQSEELNSIYDRIAEEFAPVAQKARSDWRTGIMTAIILNCLLVAFFLFVINRQTLTRLQLLMNNIGSFGSGPTARIALSGDDELTELDNTFAEVYAERLRLDEIRKSMTAMVSHDLRSPLTGMSILLDSMVEMDADNVPPNILRKLHKLRSAADRLKRMSNTLLDIEKIESGKLDVKLAAYSLSQVIEPSVALIAEVAANRKVELLTTYDSSLTVLCDEDRTVQVLVNLLSNAIKFSPKESKVETNAYAHGNSIRIEVIDRGPGVPLDQQLKLFNKFSQLEQDSLTKSQGSGLGLYICKMLVSAQQGKVGYKPDKQGGSCFWIELPAAVDDHSFREQVSP